jgi:hypothetical protein
MSGAKSKRSRSRKGPPATQEQRNAIAFGAMDVEFNWSNEEWALTFLPRIRMAALYVNGDRTKCAEIMAGVVQDGLAPDMLDGWCKTKAHLQELFEICEIALKRGFLVLEQLGYGPNNPPPDSSPAIN